MNRATALKQEVKYQKKLAKEFRTMFKATRSKVRRLKMHKPTKRLLVQDLSKCNNIDLMHFLSTVNFRTVEEYFTLINAFLELETKAHNYNKPLVYQIGQMENITNIITNLHRIKDLKDKLKKSVISNEI